MNAPEKLSKAELAALYGTEAAVRLAELQEIIADMDADDFKRLLSFSVELAAVRKPKMRRCGAPLAEAQIAYAVQLWVNGMTRTEIAMNYGYASSSAISSKIRVFSLRYAPARDDLGPKARATLALEYWREKQKLLGQTEAGSGQAEAGV